uniref:SCP domain-containing protein n=1 Tax=Mesocestoides corti TaxID=53468 RepID=A0A5K3G1K7_MESCO
MERLANKWVVGCVTRLPQPKLYSEYAGTTQILVVNNGSSPTYKEIIYAVGKEAQYFVYDNNSCTGECGLYKQIIWANLTDVGCAMKKCRYYDQRDLKFSHFMVCVYKYAGEVEDIKPYEKGAVCSRCKPKGRCVRRQCEQIPKHVKGTGKEHLNTKIAT